MEKNMKNAAVSLAAAALCAVLAVFGTASGAWAVSTTWVPAAEDVAATDEAATTDGTATTDEAATVDETATDEAATSDEAATTDETATSDDAATTDESATTDETASEEDAAVTIDYDLSSLDSILADMSADYESTLATLTAELETVNTTIGDSYEGYVLHEQAIIDWYTLVETESEQLFARLELGCEEYLKLVASTYDPETEADAMDEAIEELDESIYEDLLNDFSDDVYDDLLGSVEDEYYYGVLDDRPDDVEYDDWYAVRSDFSDDLSDAELALSRIMEDGQTAVYRTIARVELAFDYEVYDVESVLNLDVLSDELKAILDEAEADVDATVASISEGLASVSATLGETYEDYVATAEALSSWYELVLSESESLVERINDYSIEYFKQLATECQADPENAYLYKVAMAEYNYAVYEDALDAFYEGVREDALGSIDDDYLYGAIDYDDVDTDGDFAGWEEAWDDCYDEWDDVCGEIYDLKSDAKSDLYNARSDIYSAFIYNDNYDVDSILDYLNYDPAAVLASVENPELDENGYTVNSIDTIKASIFVDYDETLAALTAEFETVKATTGGTYEGYVANEQALTDWYALVQSESEAFFDRVDAGVEEYLALVASAYEADGDYDAMSDAIDDLYDSIYGDLCDDYSDDYYWGLMDDARDEYYWDLDWPDGVDYADYRAVLSDSYSDSSEASTTIYRLASDEQTTIYRIIYRVELALSYGVYDVESVLSLEVLPDDLVVILDEIEADVDTTVTTITGGLDTVSATLGDSYDDYVAAAQALTEWYALAQTETEALYDRIDAYVIEYCQTVASEVDHDDTYTLVAAMNEIYWLTYTDCTNTFYRAILDDAFEAAYDDYLAGALNTSDVSGLSGFETWAEEWEGYYEEFSAAYEEVYDQLSVEVSYLYGLDSEITSEFVYNDNFDVDSIVEAYDVEFAEELAAEEAEEAAEALEEELGDELEESDEYDEDELEEEEAA